jgi:hypothetical protein
LKNLINVISKFSVLNENKVKNFKNGSIELIMEILERRIENEKISLICGIFISNHSSKKNFLELFKKKKKEKIFLIFLKIIKNFISSIEIDYSFIKIFYNLSINNLENKNLFLIKGGIDILILILKSSEKLKYDKKFLNLFFKFFYILIIEEKIRNYILKKNNYIFIYFFNFLEKFFKDDEIVFNLILILDFFFEIKEFKNHLKIDNFDTIIKILNFTKNSKLIELVLVFIKKLFFEDHSLGLKGEIFINILKNLIFNYGEKNDKIIFDILSIIWVMSVNNENSKLILKVFNFFFFFLNF